MRSKGMGQELDTLKAEEQWRRKIFPSSLVRAERWDKVLSELKLVGAAAARG